MRRGGFQQILLLAAAGASGNVFRLEADVAGDPASDARVLYEIAGR